MTFLKLIASFSEKKVADCSEHLVADAFHQSLVFIETPV